jgi:hypothetical protein
MTLLRRCFLAFLLLVRHARLAAGDADWLYRGQRHPARSGLDVRHAAQRRPLRRAPQQAAGRAGLDPGADRRRLAARGADRSAAGRISSSIWPSAAPRASATARRGTSGRSWARASAATPTPPPAHPDRLPARSAQERPRQSRPEPARPRRDGRHRPVRSRRGRGRAKIVLAEKGRRPELTNRWRRAGRFSMPASRSPTRHDRHRSDAARRQRRRLRAFYERWYRPDRATVVMVGDADPKLMEELIAKRFGDWKGERPGARRARLRHGIAKPPSARRDALAYPGAPNSRRSPGSPLRAAAEHQGARAADLARSLAARILNRRLEAKARGEAPPMSAPASARTVPTNIADMTQLSITAREGKLAGGAERELRDHRRCAARAAERGGDRARAHRTCAPPPSGAVEGEPTIRRSSARSS